jgi:hypothetical protein
MTLDEIATRRWFRRRLKAIAETYPDLKDPDHQVACDGWLKEEEKDHAEPERPQARKRNP